ncbi:hypothetical protein [Psychrobacter aquimaris]|uniref:hypothetical protein n=1 Tax=Psychrobacter aquimaris TaxID=292733 RepID=UPI0018DFA399|nr:hypothetical protein [Psychrobacter aquimaris]
MILIDRLNDIKALQVALIELRGAKSILKRVLAGQRLTKVLQRIKQRKYTIEKSNRVASTSIPLNRLDHGELSIPNRIKNINAELDRYKVDKAKTDKREREDRRFLANEAYQALKSDKAALKKYAWTEYKKHSRQMIKDHGQTIPTRFGDNLTRNLNPRDFLRDEAKYSPENFLRILDWHLDIGG